MLPVRGKTLTKHCCAPREDKKCSLKFSETFFVSAANVARVAERVNIWETWSRQQCCRHNVSSFCWPLRPWPNGTPNSSQVEPSYKIRTCIRGLPNGTARSSQLARYRAIVWIRPRSHITITKQLGESWLELAEVAKRWNTWLELGENLNLIKFKPTRSNSCQLKPSGWPNDTQLHRSCELGSSWLELGVPFGQGLRLSFANVSVNSFLRKILWFLVPTWQYLRYGWCSVVTPMCHCPLRRSFG